MIAGVCGGLAEYFDVDPSLVRLIVILTVFLGGAGLVLYIMAWLIVPENPEHGTSASSSYEKNQKLKDEVIQELRRVGSGLAEKLEDSMEDLEGHPERRSMVFLGLGLILVGAAFLFRRFIPWLELGELWPILLIAIGILLLVSAARREKVS
jgi:phage shock protein PspC (stress-responsive transcriptional regulator)